MNKTKEKGIKLETKRYASHYSWLVGFTNIERYIKNTPHARTGTNE